MRHEPLVPPGAPVARPDIGEPLSVAGEERRAVRPCAAPGAFATRVVGRGRAQLEAGCLLRTTQARHDRIEGRPASSRRRFLGLEALVHGRMGGHGGDPPPLERRRSVAFVGGPAEVFERAQQREAGDDEVDRRPRVDRGDERRRQSRLRRMIAGVARVPPGPVEPVERLSSGIGHRRSIGVARPG